MGKRSRRQWGFVRHLPSSRWQASYWHEGKRRYAEHTFRTRADANAWLSVVQAEIVQDIWTDPDAPKDMPTFGVYAEEWLKVRDIRPRTYEQYRTLLDNHLVPQFGAIPLDEVEARAVRVWNGQLAKERRTTAANAYRLMRAIYNTAIEDEVVEGNPCRVKGAGSVESPERPLLSPPQVIAVIRAMPERLVVAVVLAAYGGLRRGEVLGLQRRDVSQLASGVNVVHNLQELHDGTVILGSPKTKKSKRFQRLFPAAMKTVLDHLAEHVAPEPEAHLFTGTKGRPLRPRDLEAAWRRARTKAEIPWARFHDLRHFFLSYFGQAGANTREVMDAGGHSSYSVAMDYQHIDPERLKALTEKFGELVWPEDDGDDGPIARGSHGPDVS